MLKLAKKCAAVRDYFASKGLVKANKLQVDLASVSKISKEYFFTAKNAAMEKRRALFQKYHRLVKATLAPIIKYCEGLQPRTFKQLPWNVRQSTALITNHAWRLLLDIAHFTRTQTIKKGKIISLHAFAAVCIRKGKVGKENEFGRVFQLGRIGGNFVIPFTCTDLRMGDKKSLQPVIKEHAALFGRGRLKNLATDMGYYSKANVTFCGKSAIETAGIQCPVNVKGQPTDQERVHVLKNRRAGIEPLIGHVKGFGLRKSKMRSDQATLSSGYRCVTAFNLHQLMRHMEGRAG